MSHFITILLSFLFIIFLQIEDIKCEGYYSIVAPGIIRPNSEYHVAVSIHNSAEPSTIKLGIISPTYSDFKTVDVQPYSTGLVQFELPDLKRDQYNLTVEGISGVLFTNETSLEYENMKVSVLIQTDKALYKPGDLVRFRILALDSNTKPAKISDNIDIIIKDGKDNQIKEFKNIKFMNGVYSDQLQLSVYPVLGEWKIGVDIMGEKHQKSFEIAEYILPKFEITIDSPKHAVYKDGKIQAIVRAKHTYGKQIVGEATISVYPKFYGSIQPFIFDLITRKVVPINGKANVEFDIKEELKFKEDYQRDIILEAIVEEKFTGRKQNTTQIVTIHKDRYNIETIKLPKYYSPNIPFEAMIRIVQHDGSPVQDTTNPVTVHLTSHISADEEINKTTYHLDNSGIVKLKFTIPDGKKDVYSIVAKYLDIYSDIGDVMKRKDQNGNYLQIDVITEHPTINQEVFISVKTNQNMKYFIYQIIGRGDILLSNAVDVQNTSSQVFKFIATFSMIPSAKIFVYYIHEGNFVFDEQTIDFEEDLQNFVKLDIATKATPEQDVDITITTKPYSYVGLMAVDQNALLLRKGNDLSFSSVFTELERFDSKNLKKKKLPGVMSGVLTLTNSNFDYIIAPSRPLSPSLTTSPEVEDDSDKMTTIKKTDIGPAHKFEVNTRPPLAGPYAFSRIPKPFWNRPRVHIMHDIEDTWLFLNISSGNEGRTTLHRRLPNTITSWVLTGFSLDPVTGLGLTKTPRKLDVLKQFFITMDLPYSIRKGEVISIPIVIFNYLDKDLDAEVTLYNTAREFDFTEPNNELVENPKIELYHRKTVKVRSKTDQSISFMIRSKMIGPIKIKVTANTQIAGDTIERNLMVEPDGITEHINKAMLVDLREKSEQKFNFTIEIPKNFIPDSEQIEVSVVGDLLGPTIKNLNKLIQLPFGSGEQNMAKFVPNVLVLKYLELTSQLSPAIELEAKRYLEIGYQRELNFKHPDGSYSSFGISDKAGSTWLTAYVARAFRQAMDYTQVEESIINSALDFLAKHQADNGRFDEVGSIIDKNHSNVSLTAFAVLAFLENTNQIPNYRTNIDKALDYIVKNLDASSDLYSLAIGTYVLQLADHSSKGSFIQTLDSVAMTDGDKKWWSPTIPESEQKSPWYKAPRSVNIEISSYAALAYLEANLLTESLPILKWLISQRNANGGFQSSQDSVVGLQALIKFSEKLSAKGTNVQVIFSYDEGGEKRINVNEENSAALQSVELPSIIRHVNVSASGRGIAVAQISYRYNTNVTGAWPRFTLDPQVNRISHSDYLHLSICTSFVPLLGGANESNMAVMEVSLPSGFTVDLDTLPSLEATDRIKKVETRKGDTVVVVYFDSLDSKEVCPTLDAFKTHKVAKHRPAPIIIYDYYDNARKARMFYSPPKSTLCDICEGSDCGNSCAEKAEKSQGNINFNGETERSSSSWLSPSLPSIFILLILYRTLF